MVVLLWIHLLGNIRVYVGGNDLFPTRIPIASGSRNMKMKKKKKVFHLSGILRLPLPVCLALGCSDPTRKAWPHCQCRLAPGWLPLSPTRAGRNPQLWGRGSAKRKRGVVCSFVRHIRGDFFFQHDLTGKK